MEEAKAACERRRIRNLARMEEEKSGIFKEYPPDADDVACKPYDDYERERLRQEAEEERQQAEKLREKRYADNYENYLNEYHRNRTINRTNKNYDPFFGGKRRKRCTKRRCTRRRCKTHRRKTRRVRRRRH